MTYAEKVSKCDEKYTFCYLLPERAEKLYFFGLWPVSPLCNLWSHRELFGDTFAYF